LTAHADNAAAQAAAAKEGVRAAKSGLKEARKAFKAAKKAAKQARRKLETVRAAADLPSKGARDRRAKPSKAAAAARVNAARSHAGRLHAAGKPKAAAKSRLSPAVVAKSVIKRLAATKPKNLAADDGGAAAKTNGTAPGDAVPATEKAAS
jgi:hypothetical protein